MSLAPPSDSLSRKSILVVEDDEGVREALCNALSPEYEVTVAVDGLDGYVKANEGPPHDLIIADVAMPRLDGVTMVRLIRENDALRRVPIIFFTGQMSSPENLLAGFSLGAVAYLPKSVSRDVLEKNVRLALNGA